MKISLIWELGGGLGHLGRQIPIANGLRGRGHDVQFFVPNRYLDHPWLKTFDVNPTPAPISTLRGTISVPNSFQDVLWNLGFRDPTWLSSTIAHWTELIGKQDPDLIVLDHSAIALFALNSLPVKLAFVGTGFAIPTSADAVLPRGDYPDRLASTERAVVKNMNQVCPGNASPFKRSVDIFDRLDFTGLATYPELDHFGPRREASYWGTWSRTDGEPVVWSRQRTHKVFVYLENELGVQNCLDDLSQRNCHVHLYGSSELREKIRHWKPEGERPEFQLEIADQPLNIAGLASDCDFAITHAGHGTTAELLRQGVPMLLVPNMGEQRMVAEKVVQIGAGLMAMADDPAGIRNSMEALISDDRYRESTSRFSAKYVDWIPDERLSTLVKELEALVDAG